MILIIKFKIITNLKLNYYYKEVKHYFIMNYTLTENYMSNDILNFDLKLFSIH